MSYPNEFDYLFYIQESSASIYDLIHIFRTIIFVGRQLSDMFNSLPLCVCVCVKAITRSMSSS
jgi:hypothetical protein